MNQKKKSNHPARKPWHSGRKNLYNVKSVQFEFSNPEKPPLEGVPGIDIPITLGCSTKNKMKKITVNKIPIRITTRKAIISSVTYQGKHYQYKSHNRKSNCPLCNSKEKEENIDFKSFLSKNGRLKVRKATGLCQYHYHQVFLSLRKKQLLSGLEVWSQSE